MLTPNPSLERIPTGFAIGPRTGHCHHPSRGPRANPASAPSTQTLGLANQPVAAAVLNKTRRRFAFAAATLVCTCATRAADPRFGELPSGSISTSETSGVLAEICRDHLFDPAAAIAGLPVGFRLISAAEAASKDTALQPLLQGNPKLRSYAIGSLCFMSVRRFAVDGESVESTRPLPVAFWWAKAEGPRHPDMRGKATWVQLGSWYPSGIQHRSAVLRTDPMAEFVDMEVEQVGANRWRLRLALPSETVTADVTGSGRRLPSRGEQPGYMSVPMSGRAARYFSVFTYYGHHHQAARGTWRASGTGVFSDAFQLPEETDALGTVLQDGWSSRAGLYRYSGQ